MVETSSSASVMSAWVTRPAPTASVPLTAPTTGLKLSKPVVIASMRTVPPLGAAGLT